jgi:diguanylate cyclase (GGDEF)-like protein/PAS domain S-box-containing protein
MVLGALCLATLIAHIQHLSDQQRQGQVLLVRLDKKACQINAYEWELAASPDANATNNDRVTPLDADAQQIMDQLMILDLHDPLLLPIKTDLYAYRKARAQELQILKTGDGIEAREANENDVLPAYITLSNAIQETDSEFSLRASAATTETDIATTAVLVIASILLFILLRRSERIQRREVSLEMESEALRQSEQRFQALVCNASDVILIVTESGEIRYVSAVAHRLWGRTPEDLVGTPLMSLLHPDEITRTQSLFAQVASDIAGNLNTEMRLSYADGTWRPSEVVLTNQISEPVIGGLVLTCRDISERRAFEEQLAHQAFHDSLTGLPNRALFMERLQHSLSRAQRHSTLVGVIFLDLDNFKIVNDSLGHAAGDQLLISVASRLETCIRPGDTAARLGGDEFTLLLEDLPDAEELTRIADRIVEALRPAIMLSGHEVFTSGSLGTAMTRGETVTPDALLRDADIAMYQAKANGKAHCVAFDHTMNAHAIERLEWESELRQALSNNEMRVYYQPIVCLETGGFREVEALVRWEHPRYGLVPPSEFIPLAEETGLIIPLGQWVLREACRQMHEWQQHPERQSLIVSVNLSARQLQHPDVVQDVIKTLQETGLDSSSLKLEITESMMMQGAETSLAKLHQLKMLGISLAVDDFGTGYSSMSYLSSLPIDTLKIDRSFVSKMHENEEGMAIVQAIVTLAKTLNLTITSEGIETWEQLVKLQALGCDQGQGYHFARPMTADQIGPLLSEHWPVPAAHTPTWLPTRLAA